MCCIMWLRLRPVGGRSPEAWLVTTSKHQYPKEMNVVVGAAITGAVGAAITGAHQHDTAVPFAACKAKGTLGRHCPALGDLHQFFAYICAAVIGGPSGPNIQYMTLTVSLGGSQSVQTVRLLLSKLAHMENALPQQQACHTTPPRTSIGPVSPAAWAPKACLGPILLRAGANAPLP